MKINPTTGNVMLEEKDLGVVIQMGSLIFAHRRDLTEKQAVSSAITIMSETYVEMARNNTRAQRGDASLPRLG